MKAEYFSDLSIAKKVKETIQGERGEPEVIEKYVDYKKVTFYIPKAELVKEGINFDEFARYAEFDIYPHGHVPVVQSDSFIIPDQTRKAMQRATEAFKMAIAVLDDILAGEEAK